MYKERIERIQSALEQGQALLIPTSIQFLIEGDMRNMADDYGVLPFPKLDEEQEVLAMPGYE